MVARSLVRERRDGGDGGRRRDGGVGGLPLTGLRLCSLVGVGGGVARDPSVDSSARYGGGARLVRVGVGLGLWLRVGLWGEGLGL